MIKTDRYIYGIKKNNGKRQIQHTFNEFHEHETIMKMNEVGGFFMKVSAKYSTPSTNSMDMRQS